ncbi:MAG: hypothetical protein HZB26_17160 [Candidatus Hydrogenedentes bacterium]|nr:hypothetical protein [Candidatus Hydrogenedentota bacterium]
MSGRISRRDFLHGTAGAVATRYIVPATIPGVLIQIAAADAQSPMRIVEPPSGVSAPRDFADIESRVYLSIEKQARNLLTKVHPWDADPSLKLMTDSKSDEHWIRPNAGTVCGLAFLYRFGSYDASVVGVSKDQLLRETLLPMLRYLTAIHVTGAQKAGDGKQWGDQWQSAHWAHMLARGAWWIWDSLPGDFQEGVRKLVAHEADRIAGMDPPHQLVNDTKAEENAWNSQILSMAVVLIPEHSRRAVWEAAFQRWALSSFLRPADEHSSAIVDGRPVSEQFTGANIYDDFTLENHGRIHPDYMGTFILSMGCALDYVMSARKAPQAATYNCAGIYENLKWFSLPSGGLVYPNGQDWELLRDPEWIYAHSLMACHAGDPDAWSLLRQSLATQDRMQARSPSGTVYLDEEYFFPSTLSDQIYYNVMAWLAVRYHGPIVDKPAPKTGVLRLDGGKLILNRTASAIHAFSWGAQVMAQFVPLRLDRITSPHARSGVGHVRLAGSNAELPVRIHNVRVASGAGRFEATLELDHGDGKVRAFLNFRSGSDGSWRIRERLVALGDIVTEEIATGLVGVLNNPHWVYETGKRRIAFRKEDRVVKSGAGTELTAEAKKASIDDVVQFHAKKPLRLLYRGAKKAERARFTDELYLNYIGGKRTWKAGEEISTYEAVVRCPVQRNAR